MKQYAIEYLNRIDGRKSMQRLYKTLHRLSLRGMNYGNGGVIEKSGELEVLNYIDKVWNHKEKVVIFDVGANVGNYTIALASFFLERATIHSFEPSLVTYRQFLENTTGLNSVVANCMGLGQEEGFVPLYTNAETSELASLYQRNLSHFSISMDKSESIKISTVDAYCAQNGVERIHFLKLDIEGHELSALNGANNMISAGKIDFIQFEFGGGNIDSRTYFQDFYYLLTKNYRLFRILRNGFDEIMEYSETNEIFVTVNYLAQLKNI